MSNLYERAPLAQLLSQGAATVEFTKKDGSQRTMHCTIAPHLIPEDMIPVGETKPLKVNLAVLRVFDLEKNDWRSFRIDSITGVTALDDRGYVTKPLG